MSVKSKYAKLVARQTFSDARIPRPLRAQFQTASRAGLRPNGGMHPNPSHCTHPTPTAPFTRFYLFSNICFEHRRVLQADIVAYILYVAFCSGINLTIFVLGSFDFLS